MRYQVDEHDRIVAVDDEFQTFAEKNGCPELATGALGRPLREFVDGDGVWELYRAVISSARAGNEVVFDFRCDGPGIARQMRMAVRSAGGGNVEFRSELLAVHPLGPPKPTPQVRGLERVCAWCGRVRYRGSWHAVSEFISATSIFETANPFDVTHGICEECQRGLEMQLDEAPPQQRAAPRAD